MAPRYCTMYHVLQTFYRLDGVWTSGSRKLSYSKSLLVPQKLEVLISDQENSFFHTTSKMTLSKYFLQVLIPIVFFLQYTDAYLVSRKVPTLLHQRNSFQNPPVASSTELHLFHPAEIVPFVTQKLAPEFLKPQAITAFYVNVPLAMVLLYTSQKSLTNAGLFHATMLGIGLWSYLGWKGWLMGALYFALGSFVTKVKMAEKERLGIAEKRHGARGPENVWGSAATAMVCAIMAAMPISPASHIWEVAFVTSFATKLADTFSSEIGKAYGKSTFLITTLKRVPRGTEGAVSVEGTVSGVIGSLLLALAGSGLGFLQSPIDLGIVLVSSFIATTLESYIGATFQRSETFNKWLNNEMVNLIMTVIGAGMSIALYKRVLP